jgi:hypothetical protein
VLKRLNGLGLTGGKGLERGPARLTTPGLLLRAVGLGTPGPGSTVGAVLASEPHLDTRGIVL